MAKNGDPSLLRLACSLANVVRQAGWQADANFCFSDFLEIKFQHFSSRFLIYNGGDYSTEWNGTERNDGLNYGTERFLKLKLATYHC